jgi:GTP1/Obg family GTP-binding protein
LLDKHVVEFYRNQSLDDFMTTMLDLQKELNAIGNNFNQVVKRIYSLKGFDAFQQWYVELSIDRKQVLHQVEKINQKLGEISDEWLR